MADISIRTDGRVGRITLRRPEALNALTYPMCLSIAKALSEWRDCRDVNLVVIDADGDRAFCAGGDIADMYRCGRQGDFAYGQRYWRDEYRMNAAINEFSKPVISFMQGFVMGGGVGVGCHGSHRIVGRSSRVAMPECGIGLVPDVGGSYLLARGPGRCGEYLGLTAARMNAADALYMGFADCFIDESHWEDVKRTVCHSGRADAVREAASDPPPGTLAGIREVIDKTFRAPTLAELMDSLERAADEFAVSCLTRIRRNSPLSMACALALIRMQRQSPDLRHALVLEYRYVFRSLEMADFLEGIRARIIDKDNRPQWRHQHPRLVTEAEVEGLLAPLGQNELTWQQPARGVAGAAFAAPMTAAGTEY